MTPFYGESNVCTMNYNPHFRPTRYALKPFLPLYDVELASSGFTGRGTHHRPIWMVMGSTEVIRADGRFSRLPT
eukprot:jgi/Botrbrau1/12516/Bobra.0169s0058.1